MSHENHSNQQMTMTNISENSPRAAAGLTFTLNSPTIDRGLLVTFAGMVVVGAFLLYRSMGLFPSIMADEFAYSLLSRHLPFSASPMPSYLYFWIFRQTNHCGNAFLDCARAFNCILFVAAAPFIYKIGRRLTTSGVAAFIALAAICLPVNVYTAYFMPEATYFTGFWVLTWFLLSFRGSPPYCYGTVAGFLVACMAMIKVHGLFLFPGVVLLVVAVILRSHSQQRIRDVAVAFGCLVAALGATRFGLGYLFAGKAGLHLLGNKYGAVADSSLNASSLLQFTSQVPFVLAGHLMTLALLFGVPLASLFLWQPPSRKDSSDDSLFLIKLYTLAIILPLLMIAAYYTVSVAPYEGIRRMHMRYYSFALPLLLLVAAGGLSDAAQRTRRYVILPLSVAVSALAISSLFALLPHYSPSLVDSPDAYAALVNPVALYVFGALAVLALAAWTANRRVGAQLFLFVFLPVGLFISNIFTARDLRVKLRPNVYESAGLLARYAVPPEDRSRVVVAGTGEGELFETLFQIDNPNTRTVKLLPGEPLAPVKIPADAEWVVVIGDHKPPPGTEIQNSMEGYLLFSRTSPDAIRFSRPLRSDVVSTVNGLSGMEPGGRWSDANQVELEMASPLPPVFQFNLTASAFGPNADLPFTIRIGSDVQSFRLPATKIDVSLRFHTNGDQRKIVIEVPKPTSPSSIGFNGDTRQLGILLEQMTIVPLAEAATDESRVKLRSRQ